MKLERSFTVPRPADEAWAGLDDPGRVFDHLPGAEVGTDTAGADAAGDGGWTCSWTLPSGRTVRGRLRETARDDAGHRLTLTATGATRTATLEIAVSSVHDGTAQVHVEVDADVDEPDDAQVALAAFCDALLIDLTTPPAEPSRTRSPRPRPTPPGTGATSEAETGSGAQAAGPAGTAADADDGDGGELATEERDEDVALAEGAAGGPLDPAGIAATATEPGGFADPGEWARDEDDPDRPATEDRPPPRAEPAGNGTQPATGAAGAAAAATATASRAADTAASTATGWLDAARPLALKAAGPAAVALVIVLGVVTKRRRSR